MCPFREIYTSINNVSFWRNLHIYKSRKLDINKQCVLSEKTRHQYTMCPFREI